MVDGRKEIGDQSQNHSGMCRLWKTQHKSSQNRWMQSKNKASGEKSLENYMNGPHHLKRNLTHGIKAAKAVPKEEVTY